MVHLTREDVLAYYCDYVIEAIAVAQFTDDAFPAGVLNDIRDAMTHLSRSNHKNFNEVEKQKELLRAKNHLERVHLDCTKLAYAHFAERFDVMYDLVLSAEQPIPAGFIKKASDQRQKRIDLSIKEGKNAPFKGQSSIVNELKELSDDFQKLIIEFNRDVGGAILFENSMSPLLEKKKELDERYLKLNLERGLHEIAVGYHNLNQELAPFLDKFYETFPPTLLENLAKKEKEGQKDHEFRENVLKITQEHKKITTDLNAQLQQAQIEAKATEKNARRRDWGLALLGIIVGFLLSKIF